MKKNNVQWKLEEMGVEFNEDNDIDENEENPIEEEYVV